MFITVGTGGKPSVPIFFIPLSQVGSYLRRIYLTD